MPVICAEFNDDKKADFTKLELYARRKLYVLKHVIFILQTASDTAAGDAVQTTQGDVESFGRCLQVAYSRTWLVLQTRY